MTGYSLWIRCSNARREWVSFPQPDRKTKRFPLVPGGRFRFVQSAFYRMNEPPRVPVAGNYLMRLHGADGKLLLDFPPVVYQIDACFPSVRFHDKDGEYDPDGRPLKPGKRSTVGTIKLPPPDREVPPLSRPRGQADNPTQRQQRPQRAFRSPTNWRGPDRQEQRAKSDLHPQSPASPSSVVRRRFAAQIAHGPPDSTAALPTTDSAIPAASSARPRVPTFAGGAIAIGCAVSDFAVSGCAV